MKCLPAGQTASGIQEHVSGCYVRYDDVQDMLKKMEPDATFIIFKTEDREAHRFEAHQHLKEGGVQVTELNNSTQLQDYLFSFIAYSSTLSKNFTRSCLALSRPSPVA